jgi:hypothetical protein
MKQWAKYGVHCYYYRMTYIYNNYRITFNVQPTYLLYSYITCFSYRIEAFTLFFFFFFRAIRNKTKKKKKK